MHSPAFITSMLLATVGVPLAALFLLFFIGSLFFARSRSFAGQLLTRSLLGGVIIACLMWLFAQSSLPLPYSYRAALSAFPLGFGLGGFVSFFALLHKARHIQPQTTL